MLKKDRSMIWITGLCGVIIILLTPLFTPSTVYADSPHPTPDNGNCVVCHEDLYFLHDTGNWFCLKESPMTCVNCHGGNPSATIKEAAHTNRAAHPIINDDISKCQECHPDKAPERTEIFAQTAGISRVLVAEPYTPVYVAENAQTIPVTAQTPNIWTSFMEILSFLVFAGVVCTIYIICKVKYAMKEKP